MEYMKKFIEEKMTVNERVKLIKQLMDVDIIYEEIKDYILADLEEVNVNEFQERTYP